MHNKNSALDVMVFRLNIIIVAKTLEERVTNQMEPSLNATENGRDAPKTMAAATSLQKRIIIGVLSYIIVIMPHSL